MTNNDIQDRRVSVLLLRLNQKEILIPKAMVADVLSWNKDLFTAAKMNRGEWKLGEYSWNDWNIPLICFESLIQPDKDKEEMLKRKIVVLKSFQKGFEDEHYAIQCRGFPKPLILSEESLDNLDTEDNQEWIAYSISIGSRILDIPDFEAMESTVWSMQHPVENTA